MRTKQLGMEFAVWVFKHVSDPRIASCLIQIIQSEWF